MSGLSPDILKDIEKHVTESIAAGDQTAQPPEGQGPPASTPAPPAAPEGAQPPAGGTETPPAPPQGTEAPPPATGDEPPNEYFGVDLSDLPAETRSTIIAELKERDKFVNKVLQENAELKKEQPAPTEQAPPSPPAEPEQTDEEILAMLGYDKNDPLFEVKSEVALPLAKALLSIEGRVEAMQQEQVVQETLDYWNSSLDELEAEYGKLPVDRDAVFAFAAENQVFDPIAAYHRISAPARKQLTDAATVARQKVMEDLKARKEAAGGTVRPGSSVSTEEKEIQARNLREATKLAAAQAAQESGISWDDALENTLSE